MVPVSRERQDSLTHPPYVGYYKWLCPTRLPVREYLAGIMDTVAATDGIDAVHLDYIRHPDVILPRNLWEQYGLVQDHEMATFDFCYCEVCRERFERESGRDPLWLTDPTSDVEWRAFRWRMVSETVQALAQAGHDREGEEKERRASPPRLVSLARGDSFTHHASRLTLLASCFSFLGSR